MRTLAAVVVVTALALVVPGGAAQAGASCGAVFGCSVVKNQDNLSIVARHNWTCDWGSTGSSSTGCVGGSAKVLAYGQSTPLNEDWDVIRVDYGWCYKIHFVNWYGKSWDVKYDRRGLTSDLFVKVENGSYGFVRDQSYTSCPA